MALILPQSGLIEAKSGLIWSVFLAFCCKLLAHFSAATTARSLMELRTFASARKLPEKATAPAGAEAVGKFRQCVKKS
jgi:hypothetical protein